MKSMQLPILISGDQGNPILSMKLRGNSQKERPCQFFLAGEFEHFAGTDIYGKTVAQDLLESSEEEQSCHSV